MIDAGSIIEQNKQVYNRVAAEFSSSRSFLWEDLKLPEFHSFLKEGDRVLDLGCGNGRLYGLFSGRSVSYIGLDQSEELIFLAKKQFPTVQFDVGEMTELPYPDASFEVVYAIASFHHLPTIELQKKALHEIARVLTPQGKLVMLNWNLESSWAKERVASGAWAFLPDGKNVRVPWRSSLIGTMGERDRIYYAFTLKEIEERITSCGFLMEKELYLLKGDVSTVDSGENIFTMATKMS